MPSVEGFSVLDFELLLLLLLNLERIGRTSNSKDLSHSSVVRALLMTSRVPGSSPGGSGVFFSFQAVHFPDRSFELLLLLLFGKDWENFIFKGSVGEVNCLKREKNARPTRTRTWDPACHEQCSNH